MPTNDITKEDQLQIIYLALQYLYLKKYNFLNPYHQKYSILPRPYKTRQTNGNVKSVGNDLWFKNLLFDINIYFRLHLQPILISIKKEGNENRIMKIQSIIQSINFLEQYSP